MTKNSKTLPSKESKPRGLNGGRKPTVSEDDRKEQANLWLPRWLNRALRELVPVGADRNNLLAGWVRAYVISGGETDRLLAQSPLSLRLLNYLEAIGTPDAEDYAEELLSLIVARESDEAKLVDGVIKLKGDSYIV